MFSFELFLSRLRLFFSEAPEAGTPTGFLGFFLGAAIWTGLLWLPIDFWTEAYRLFGVASIILSSFVFLILIGYCCSLCIPSPNQHMLVHCISSLESLSQVKVLSQEENKKGCCAAIGKFGCSGWSSLFLAFLFNVSISPLTYFLIDWQITSCNNANCFQIPYLGLNDMNYPLRTYWLLSATSAIGYFGLSVIEGLCSVSWRLEMPVTILTMAMFDVALFAIGYTGNQPWWTILLLISQGFYLSSFWFIKDLANDIFRLNNPSSDLYGLFWHFFSIFVIIGQIIGISLISYVLSTSDYSKLFKILSVLVLLTWILMIILHIIRGRASRPPEHVSVSAKPRMIFKKSVKSA